MYKLNNHNRQIDRYLCRYFFISVQNVPLGYWVTQVFAEDKDAGINGIVEYEMIETPNNQDWKKFSISKKEGNLTTNDDIDREHQETYYVITLFH